MTFNAMYGYLKQSVAVQNLEPQADGSLSVSSSAWGFGANVGGTWASPPSSSGAGAPR